ncbi:hypothetical protein V2605_03555 [Tenacibaculum maritimum]|uniref:hypothetical protein n=1 Tax=Tenacibaculum maritimum TaxID=107401 RepID=UPI0012E52CBA|nr:hypothetical protein [Tenacibaculum maritimum]CAA0254303.1 conserved hypothetical protein [Tenacibaculum maritimum]
MILGFSTKFPRGKGTLSEKPTRFPEKIISSLDIETFKKLTQFDLLAETQEEKDWLNVSDFLEIKPKLHTIRRDTKNRWKAGNKIHFSIGVRTKKQYQFAPVLKCVSIQDIEIRNDNGMVGVSIDNKELNAFEIIKLSINDGFDSVEDFFEWFNEDFKGKIIHWTDLTY